MQQRGLRLFIKRSIDKAAAGALLVALGPAMGAVAGAVRASLGGPVLFRQERSGRDGKPFTIVKFRTMRDARGRGGRLLPDAERLTALGRFLRASSLDELPQLYNVWRGDMSLVGPRPLPPAFASRYRPHEARRLLALPGITGWAQVNGRNTLSWEEKFLLDTWYVQNWSLRLDLRILWRTLPLVLRAEAISNPGNVTSVDFRGAKPSGETTPAERRPTRGRRRGKGQLAGAATTLNSGSSSGRSRSP